MSKISKTIIFLIFILAVYSNSFAAPPISEKTKECIECHRQVSPGIVSDWERSRHSFTTPAGAIKKNKKINRRISTQKPPAGLSKIVVGCAECHTMNPEKHKDTFEHEGFKVHTVVTPDDCSVCHPEEAAQYSLNKMSWAHTNLMNNPLYHDLEKTTNGAQNFDGEKTSLNPPDLMTSESSCLFCHGSKVEVKGSRKKETAMGEMEFPILSGWPNQGVGRINPDGSRGSCSSCHARHQFAIELARNPATCGECHSGPDVVVYKVYLESKHGNIFKALGSKWKMKNVPWTVGADFNAPMCAVCHVSLLVDKRGEIIAQRTHQMNDRLYARLFGLVYAHPQPKSADTSIIKNKAGLPLPTELTGEPAGEFLIDKNEQEARKKKLKKICQSCHSGQWVDNKFEILDNTIEKTNQMTLTATKILLKAWDTGAARGLAQNDSIFNETIEKKWVEQWLFYANATRFSAAMDGADYGVFANGRWYMSRTVQEMGDILEEKRKDR